MPMSALFHAGPPPSQPQEPGADVDYVLNGLAFPAVAGLDALLTQRAREWLIHLGLSPASCNVEVLWNGRLKTTAGTACVRTMRVELNPRLHELGLEQISRTLRHELAHLVAHVRSGKRAHRIQTHGVEWRRACAALGIAGEPAFHDLPFERRSLARKYAYECPNCGLIAYRVRKFERFTACFQCCKKYNRGVYHPKFQFRRIHHQVTVSPPSGADASSAKPGEGRPLA